MASSHSKSQRDWDKHIETFLKLDTGFLGGGHELSWQPLREFFETVRNSNPYANISHLPRNSCRILYDSISHDGKRDRKVLDDKELFQHTEAQNARRITYYITDMSPLCAATLGIKENRDFVHSFREYLSCHLSGETYFVCLKPRAHNASSNNAWPRHVATSRKFTYEFHFRYVAMRDRRSCVPDPRGLRSWYTLIGACDPYRDIYEDSGYELACYDASVSFLIIGTDETHWKAYCNSDTWFGDNMPIEQYIDKNLDAPAGDARKATEPCKDPKEYFLLVLAHRLRQLSHEWGNVYSALLTRLSAYEAHYLRSIDDPQGDLHDDKSLTRTRSYLKAASMLRSFHDTLTTTIDTLEKLTSDNEDMYEQQDNFEDSCGCYQIIIDNQKAHLTRIRNRFFERMQRFESMRDSMMTASLLRENRQATQQSSDIELLTKATVVYLPFSLAAAFCGMSEQRPPYDVFFLWVCISALLGAATFFPAFKLWSLWDKVRHLFAPTGDETRRVSQPISLPPN